MIRSRIGAAFACSLFFALAAVLMPPVVAAPSPQRVTSTAAHAATAARSTAKKAHSFSPVKGVVTNNPLSRNPDDRYRILNKIIRAINHVKNGGRIRIISWNIRSDSFVNALLRANGRGASVKVIIAHGNAVGPRTNPIFYRLKRGLAAHPHPHKPSGQRSRAMRCWSSCRGGTGIAHIKMFMFSQTGSARGVVMYGSANATKVAALDQWNDLYTIKNRPEVYAETLGVFRQMLRDKRVKGDIYAVESFDNLRLGFYPYTGRNATGDPDLKILRRVSCTGATNVYRGRTKIRILMTSWTSARGLALAKQLKRLNANGCDIKVVYGVMGNRVLDTLRSGRVPVHQVATDWNCDGLYDRYLHMKVLAIRGNYNGNKRAHMAWNGSANWTPVALVSDEVVGEVNDADVSDHYIRDADRLFRTDVGGYCGTAAAAPEARRLNVVSIPPDTPLGTKIRTPDGRLVDPYAKVQVN